MFATVVDVLTRPGEFFASHPDPGLKRPALLVGATGLVQGLTVVVFLAQFRELLRRESAAGDGVLAVGAVVVLGALVAVALLGWLLLAGFLYAVSYRTSGRGGGRALLAAVGWGWLPLLLAALVILATAVLVVSQLSPPTDEATAREFARQVEEGSLVALAGAAGTARATATGSFSQVQTVAGVLAPLWSGYVWLAAVERFRGLTRWQARLAVAIPVLVMILG